MADTKDKVFLGLIIILVIALSVRITFFVTRTPIIENEGGELATIAENLLEGKGYIGQGLTGKPQLSIPPFYPYSIALLASITKNTETAGRILSLAMGLWLVVAVYMLGTYIYSQRVGMIAAVLAAAHPLLVKLSVLVQTESMYYALVLSGVYFGLKAIESNGLKYFLGAGVFYSVAYLTRPEAFLFILLTGGYVFIVAFFRKEEWKRTFSGIIAMTLLFLIIASPYIYYLYRYTGKFHMEGKTPVNFAIGQLVLSGRSGMESVYGVDDDLNEYGVYMGDINRYYMPNVNNATPGELFTYSFRAVKEQMINIYNDAVKMPAYGGPFLLALVVMGLFRSPWDRSRAMKEFYLFSIVLSIIVVILSVLFFQSRYLYLLLPILLLWGAKGIDEIASWMGKTLNLTVKSNVVWITRIPHVVRIILVFGILSVAAWYDISEKHDDLASRKISCINTKNAGLWLKDQPPPDKVVMDAGSAVPYYSRAEYIALPYASSSTAIKYMYKKSPDYIVLRGALSNQRPYLREWLTEGIPDRHAILIYDVGNRIEDTIKIYKWSGK
jgi:4-amino-4-deoxy-L-arabinose transferase-like glycosyltransferase